jgi:hypothetical protein
MAGCLKNSLAGVGCLTLLVVGAAVGWRYRAQVAGLYHSFRGSGTGEGVTEAPPEAIAPEVTARAPAVAPDTLGPAPSSPSRSSSPRSSPRARPDAPVVQSPSPVGWPSEVALRTARRKQDAMERADGPATVTLTAAEMASLIEEGLDPAGRQALDSLQVVLTPGRLELRASLVTDNLSGMLGPFAAMFKPREPMRASGPARVARPGVVTWEPDSFMLRAFPFPSEFVPPLVDRLTGGQGGAVPIRVPATVGDVRIAPQGITFSRREEL